MSNSLGSHDRRMLLAGAGLLGAAALTRLAHAGPLDPPPGPITPTGKTLIEVEPRIALSQSTVGGPQTVSITSPGSYYLTGNVSATALGPSISITASNATLDLRGFTVNGRATPGSNAIDVVGNNVTIRDGSVQGAGGVGINAPGAIGFIGQGLRVFLNGGNGIVAGDTAQLSGTIARGNGGGGIVLGAAANVVDTTVRLNSGTGLDVGTCSVVDRVVSAGNGGQGIAAAANSNILQSVACSNTLNGFRITSSTTLSFCTATSNGAAGFATTNALDAACTLNSCSAVTNGGVGFVTGSGFFLSGCHANLNASHGFVIQTQCRVFDCHSDRNSFVGGAVGAAAGFAINEGGNHIEQCSASENGFGFLGVPTTPSLIVRNYASFNGTPASTANYSISSPGTTLGPIVTSVAAVTNPYANVSQ